MRWVNRYQLRRLRTDRPLINDYIVLLLLLLLMLVVMMLGMMYCAVRCS